MIFGAEDRLSKVKVRIQFIGDKFLGIEACLLDGAVSILPLVFLLKLSFTKCPALYFIVEYPRLRSEK